MHSNSYNIFDAEKTVDDFIEVARENFVPNDNVEVKGSVYLLDYQPAQSSVIIELEDKKIWLTDVYRCDFFNQFVRQKIKENFMRRVIVNGLTGSSWRFKRFKSLTISTINKSRNLER